MTTYLELEAEAIHPEDSECENSFIVEVLLEVDSEWQDAEPSVGIMGSGFILHSFSLESAMKKDGEMVSIDEYDFYHEGEEIHDESEFIKETLLKMLDDERQSSIDDAKIQAYMDSQW